jgi:molybdopterin synthase catalytic subunit
LGIRICHDAFNPWQEIQAYQAAAFEATGQFGATCAFIGTMRDYNDGGQIKSMTLDYYPGMTEKQLVKIVEQAAQKWQIMDSFLLHRVGEIRPDDAIVLVAVWSAHRGDAFDACRLIMEALKSTAPFWKKETLASGQSRWVEKNTDGYRKS